MMTEFISEEDRQLPGPADNYLPQKESSCRTVKPADIASHIAFVGFTSITIYMYVHDYQPILECSGLPLHRCFNDHYDPLLLSVAAPNAWNSLSVNTSSVC